MFSWLFRRSRASPKKDASPKGASPKKDASPKGASPKKDTSKEVFQTCIATLNKISSDLDEFSNKFKNKNTYNYRKFEADNDIFLGLERQITITNNRIFNQKQTMPPDTDEETENYYKEAIDLFRATRTKSNKIALILTKFEKEYRRQKSEGYYWGEEDNSSSKKPEKRSPSPSPDKDPSDGPKMCPSYGRKPKFCEENLNPTPAECAQMKKKYLKQVRIFHPDKNSGCSKEDLHKASENFKLLQNSCNCEPGNAKLGGKTKRNSHKSNKTQKYKK